jgi:hypothetical protein
MPTAPLRGRCRRTRLGSLLVAGALVITAGCSAGPATPSGASPAPSDSSSSPIKDSSGPAADQDDDAIRLLFLGNSHTARHDVPGTVAALWRAADPAVDVVAVRSSASMLTNERQSHRPSRALVASRAWDVVVIQGQNYSTSGRYEYPTTGAETFARLARDRGAQPVLYAEWPRRDVDESARIVATYARVTEREPSCLPPVPESFDLALRRYPGLVLHAEDGNHSSPAGAFLASVVLWASMSGGDPTELPAVVVAGVPATVQARLRPIAAEAVAALATERRCDPVG